MAQFDDRFLDINDYGVLRIPLEAWFAMLILTRYWVMTLIALSSMVTNQLEAVTLFGGSFSWWMFVAEAPAALTLWLCFQRLPTASPLVRHLWPYARLLLLLTALFHFMNLCWHLWITSYWSRWPELFLVSCTFLDITCAYGLYSSPYLKQVFAEFPEAAEKPS